MFGGLIATDAYFFIADANPFMTWQNYGLPARGTAGLGTLGNRSAQGRRSQPGTISRIDIQGTGITQKKKYLT
jgi:hypothetical protein